VNSVAPGHLHDDATGTQPAIVHQTSHASTLNEILMSDTAPADLPLVDVRPTDRERIPPGQAETKKWPVLHYGDVPAVDAATWRIEFRGACEAPATFTLAEIQALPRQITRCDMHCVTRWSRLNNDVEGVDVQRHRVLDVAQWMVNAFRNKSKS
jgi:DMSO/TMAO reductase YedYZ molybdopterin-dependent catalytic subunit